MKYSSGIAEVVSLLREGDPTITAVTGISSARTVISSDIRMALAISAQMGEHVPEELDSILMVHLEHITA